MIITFGVSAFHSAIMFNSAFLNWKQRHNTRQLTGALQSRFIQTRRLIQMAVKLNGKRKSSVETQDSEKTNVIANTLIVALDIYTTFTEQIPHLIVAGLFIITILASIPYYHYHFVKQNYANEGKLYHSGKAKALFKQIMLDNAFNIFGVCIPSIIIAGYD